MNPAQWSCTKPGRPGVAERTPPPGCGECSSTVTGTPRSASVHAHTSPLWPPPTTSTRRGEFELTPAFTACGRRANAGRPEWAPRTILRSPHAAPLDRLGAGRALRGSAHEHERSDGDPEAQQ